MAPTDVVFGERVTSRNATGNSLNIKALARGSLSTFDVREAIALRTDLFPPSNGLNPTLWINYAGVQIDQVEGVLDAFDCVIPYIYPTNKSERERREERQDYSWHWEEIGRVETTRVTRSFESKRKKPGGTLDPTNMRLIGYDQATGAINGTDVAVYATETRVSFYMPTSLVTNDFRKQVRAARGKVDTSGLLGETAKTVRLADASFSNDSQNYQNTKIDYTFWIADEVTVDFENVGSVTIPPHWVVDVYTEEFHDADLGIDRARPTVVFVHRVCPEADLSFLMPPDPSGSSSEE